MIVGGVLRIGLNVGVIVGVFVGIDNVGDEVGVIGSVGIGDGVVVAVSITGAKVACGVGVHALRDIRINKNNEKHFMGTPPKLNLFF